MCTHAHAKCGLTQKVREQRVTLAIDGAMRRVSRKLSGTIVDWNAVDSMYTLDTALAGRLNRCVHPS